MTKKGYPCFRRMDGLLIPSPKSICFCPLHMPQCLFTFACRVVDALEHGVDDGHGKGPWEDVVCVVKRAIHEPHDQGIFWPTPDVDVDMRARRAKVEERTIGLHLLLHRQEQSEFMWRHRTQHTIHDGCLNDPHGPHTIMHFSYATTSVVRIMEPGRWCVPAICQ